MIGQLTGTITELVRNPLIMNIRGVGYLVHVAPNTLAKLPRALETSLFIHTHVRDDILDLYGFTSQEELDLFELLLTVSGIGPKTALGVIDRGVAAIKKAISTSNVTFFTTVPRLGKKNAQKIIIELSHKLGSLKELDLSSSESTQDLVDALTSMGFSQTEALKAVRKISDPDAPVELQLKEALKYIGKK